MVAKGISVLTDLLYRSFSPLVKINHSFLFALLGVCCIDPPTYLCALRRQSEDVPIVSSYRFGKAVIKVSVCHVHWIESNIILSTCIPISVF